MSIQAALHFIRDLRENPGLREQIGPGRKFANIKDLLELAGQRGWKFDENALHAAFRIDWSMRAALFGGKVDAVPARGEE